MKQFELKALGVEELTPGELRKENGGSIIGWFIGAILGGLLYDIIANPGETADAWNKGKEMALNG